MLRGLEYGCAETPYVYTHEDSTGTRCITQEGMADFVDGKPTYRETIRDKRTTVASSMKGSLGYRLGIAGTKGPIRGMEIGLHLEAPTQPASAEFDFKAGLPAPARLNIHHSLSVGWGIGLWADNSWFGEYALSRVLGPGDLFCGYRATWLASQTADLTGATDDRRFPSRRRLIHQADVGYMWNLPAIVVLPDFIAPLAVLTYPLAPAGSSSVPAFILDDHLWEFSLGMGWKFE